MLQFSSNTLPRLSPSLVTYLGCHICFDSVSYLISLIKSLQLIISPVSHTQSNLLKTHTTQFVRPIAHIFEQIQPPRTHIHTMYASHTYPYIHTLHTYAKPTFYPQRASRTSLQRASMTLLTPQGASRTPLLLQRPPMTHLPPQTASRTFLPPQRASRTPYPYGDPLGLPYPYRDPLGLPYPHREPLGLPYPHREPLGLPYPHREILCLPFLHTEPLTTMQCTELWSDRQGTPLTRISNS